MILDLAGKVHAEHRHRHGSRCTTGEATRTQPHPPAAPLPSRPHQAAGLPRQDGGWDRSLPWTPGFSFMAPFHDVHAGSSSSCIHADGPPLLFLTFTTIWHFSTLNFCYSSLCYRNMYEECTAALDGSAIPSTKEPRSHLLTLFSAPSAILSATSSPGQSVPVGIYIPIFLEFWMR